MATTTTTTTTKAPRGAKQLAEKMTEMLLALKADLRRPVLKHSIAAVRTAIADAASKEKREARSARAPKKAAVRTARKAPTARRAKAARPTAAASPSAT